MDRFDMFKNGFWFGMGRTTARILLIAVAGKTLIYVTAKSLKKSGGYFVDKFVKGFVDKIDNMSEEEIEKFKRVSEKLSEEKDNIRETIKDATYVGINKVIYGSEEEK